MTPAQLDHLKRIDAHLANLLSSAEKRTPGNWVAGGRYDKDYIDAGDEVFCTGHRSNAAFIASCAGNAEAGWKATRAAIAAVRLIVPQHCPQSLLRENDEVQNAYDLMTDILAAFPNV